MVEKMDIEGGVTAFKSGMQVFENTTHHLEQIIEEADPPGAIGAMTQTAKVIQWNFTIITAAIVLVALAYLRRTFREPEPHYFITLWFGLPIKGSRTTGKFSFQWNNERTRILTYFDQAPRFLSPTKLCALLPSRLTFPVNL